MSHNHIARHLTCFVFMKKPQGLLLMLNRKDNFKTIKSWKVSFLLSTWILIHKSASYFERKSFHSTPICHFFCNVTTFKHLSKKINESYFKRQRFRFCFIWTCLGQESAINQPKRNLCFYSYKFLPTLMLNWLLRMLWCHVIVFPVFIN